MENGLYRVEFKTPLGSGAGVAILDNGVVRGGDSLMYYSGTYQASGGQFSAEIVSDKHTTVPDMDSVFGVNKANIQLAGQFNGNVANAKGSSPQAPGVTFDATLTRISD